MLTHEIEAAAREAIASGALTGGEAAWRVEAVTRADDARDPETGGKLTREVYVLARFGGPDDVTAATGAPVPTLTGSAIRDGEMWDAFGWVSDVVAGEPRPGWIVID